MKGIIFLVLIFSLALNLHAFNPYQNSVTIEWVSDPELVSTKLQQEEGDAVGLADIGLLHIKKCTIWALEPQNPSARVDDNERMHILGHEVLHCFRGRFHERIYE